MRRDTASDTSSPRKDKKRQRQPNNHSVSQVLSILVHPLVVATLFGLFLGIAVANLETLFQALPSTFSCDAGVPEHDLPRVTPLAVTTNHNGTGQVPASFYEDLLELHWPFGFRFARIYVIHVGKTGGATLNEALKFKIQQKKFLECRMHRNVVMDPCRNAGKRPGAANVSHLTQRAYAHMHMREPVEVKRNAWLANHTNVLLFTIRDPLQRFASALNYHRFKVLEGKWMKRKKRNKKANQQHHDPRTVLFFQRCVETMQDLARWVDPRRGMVVDSQLSLSDVANATQCRDWATGVATGDDYLPHTEHLHYNYQYYVNRAWKGATDKHIAVVRTEHLWHDIARLETLLGGDARRFWNETLQVSHGSERYATAANRLTHDGVTAMCCVLSGELQAYQDLVVAAINLQRSEKRVTLVGLHGQCRRRQSSVEGIEEATYASLSTFSWDQWSQRNCRPSL